MALDVDSRERTGAPDHALRMILSHEVDGARAPRIHAEDRSQTGEVSKFYLVLGDSFAAGINFQDGPVPEKGINGLTNEALLAILIDRLGQLQAGPFPCVNNAIAISHCEQALRMLKQRTIDRIKRGVEGKLEA